MTTETFKRVEGRRVVASDTAESIGTVKGFVLDPSGRSVEAIHVDGHGKRARILDWSGVAAVGADAVMAAPSADVSTIEDDHQQAAVKGAVTMIGTRVLTTAGREVGTVVDVEFDVGSGHVVHVDTDHGSVAAERLRSLGSYALVVDDPDASTRR
jgi:uncharacterized protein YrrD